MVFPTLRNPESGNARYIFAAAAVCLLCLSVLILWFFLGLSREEEASAPSPQSLSSAEQLCAMLTGFDDGGSAVSQGAGFFAFSGDVVVTNFHTVDYCTRVTVTGRDGSEYRVSRVLAWDPELDVAILRVSRDSILPALPCGSTDSLLPEDTLTSVSRMPVTGTFLGISQGEADGERLLWCCSQAPESGSPLLDNHGRVVGMTAADFETGTAGAVSVETLRSLLLQSEDSIPLKSLRERIHPGFSALRSSKPVDFYSLIADPRSHEGECIRLLGRAVSTEEYTVSARSSLLFLMPAGSPASKNKPAAPLWEGATCEDYFFYWFETPFAQSLLLKCADSTHTLKTARYQGKDVLVCGIYHYEEDAAFSYASVELLYTDSPNVLDILSLPNP